MRRPSRKAAVAASVAAALAGALLAFVTSDGAADAPRAGASGASAARRGPPRELLEGRRVAPLPEGRKAILTLDPGLQDHMTALFDRYDVPWAAVVAIEPSTGRVLAYVSHSSANPDAADLALDATPPTASVFKVITGAALIDAGVSPDAQVCYHGGFSRLTAADLAD